MKKDEAISILATSVRPREAKDRARYDEAVKMAIEALKSSERTAETAQNVSDSDLISRKAAIDELISEPPEMNYGFYYAEKIKALPSAQPERTCVNCGRTANNGGWYADGRTRCPIEEHYALPKDGYCHLWEKRNVTDDNYPERREE